MYGQGKMLLLSNIGSCLISSKIKPGRRRSSMHGFIQVGGKGQNVIFKHPTPDYKVDTEFAEEAIILTITYSDGTIAKRYEYKDTSNPATIFVNRAVQVDEKTGEVTIVLNSPISNL
jgi:hypothetical protein